MSAAKKSKSTKKRKEKKVEWSEAIAIALQNVPNSPGVYEMLNEDEETLYVGKAKSLRKRVQSYFRPSAQHSPRIQKMLEKTTDLTWTEVSSEVEALILETNLIKEKRPKFNILMRDDKNFAYFCVTLQEDFPRILMTRRVVKDGSMYFGPKTSATSIRETISLLQDIFQFRSTNLEITEQQPGIVTVTNPGNIKYPCLNYHIGKCKAPCVGNIAKAEYRDRINGAIQFLRGHVQEVLKDLAQHMQTAAAAKQFEKAARLRDLYLTVQMISEKQIISAPNEFSADVIGAVSKFDHAFFHLFQIREGKVINSETFSLPAKNADNLSESLLAFLREHVERAADIPKSIVVSRELFPEEEREAWEAFFAKQWEQSVEISLPQKGKRQKLLELAEQNAESYAKRNSASFLKHAEDVEEALKTLEKKLAMKKSPQRIECYDISHLGGTETVASMSVMIDGELKNSHYRRFQLTTIDHGEIDDFKSMQEVLSRRLQHISQNSEKMWKEKGITFGKGRKSEQETIKEICEQEPDILLLKDEEIVAADFTIAHKKKEIVAFARLIETDDIQELKSVWVAPEFRGEKLGQALIQKILRPVKSGKVYSILGNSELQQYYGSLGFTFIHTPPSALQKRMDAYCKQHPQLLKAPKPLVMMYDGKKHSTDMSLSALPDLIVIDGGKGQLSSAVTILEQFPFAKAITICSLAKKLEEVFVPGTSKPLDITKESAEGKLLQQLRDEAHRFAISYHKKLHEKNQQKSALDDLPGVGGKTKKKLLREFGSIGGIREASDEELLGVVSAKILKVLRRNL